MRGNLAMIELLLEHGADPNLRDRSSDATPAGWAQHHNQTEAATYLSRREDRPPQAR
jgi:ankyrin repeat protein